MFPWLKETNQESAQQRTRAERVRTQVESLMTSRESHESHESTESSRFIAQKSTLCVSSQGLVVADSEREFTLPDLSHKREAALRRNSSGALQAGLQFSDHSARRAQAESVRSYEESHSKAASHDSRISESEDVAAGLSSRRADELRCQTNPSKRVFKQSHPSQSRMSGSGLLFAPEERKIKLTPAFESSGFKACLEAAGGKHPVTQTDNASVMSKQGSHGRHPSDQSASESEDDFTRRTSRLRAKRLRQNYPAETDSVASIMTDSSSSAQPKQLTLGKAFELTLASC